MNRPFIIKLQSGLINILTCLVAITIVLYRQDWFGKGDTYAFVFWTVPLAVGLSVTGKTIVNLFGTSSFLLRPVFIILIAGLLSFGWAYCVALVLGPWIGAFSIPILYLWIGGSILQLLFLDWRLSKQTEKLKTSKVILGLLTFPLTLIVMVIGMYFFSFASSYLTRPEKETYLIPEGYVGTVLVIFNQPDGEKPQYIDGRRIYRIPQTGILFTQLKDEQGLINQEYFYISQNGQKRKLGVLDTRDFNEEWTTEKNPHEPPRDSLAIFNPGTMGTMGGSDDKKSKVFLQLSVGTYNDMKNLHDFSNDYIDSLQNANRKKNGL
ncbi:MAG: hypothetical protein V4651_10460 [Bacteroidota bacterium]